VTIISVYLRTGISIRVLHQVFKPVILFQPPARRVDVKT
jgi:hypothetical protein